MVLRSFQNFALTHEKWGRELTKEVSRRLLAVFLGPVVKFMVSVCSLILFFFQRVPKSAM